MTFFEFGKLNIKLISLALITTFFAFSLNAAEYTGRLSMHWNDKHHCTKHAQMFVDEVFEGISAKQLGILITEERNDLITRFDHALYLGRELQKAEECLYKKLPYIQD